MIVNVAPRAKWQVGMEVDDILRWAPNLSHPGENVVVRVIGVFENPTKNRLVSPCKLEVVIPCRWDESSCTLEWAPDSRAFGQSHVCE